MEDNERWLTDGDCSKCRRQNYCKKSCKKNKRRFYKTMNGILTEWMDERTGGVYSKIIEHSPYRL